MKETVTIEEAIKKGKQRLLLPRILFLLGLFLFIFLVWMFFAACGNINGSPRAAKFVTVLGFIVAGSFIPFVFLPFLFWSRRTTQWKLWAFENVTNVHELSRVALRAALFANRGTLIDRLQIQSRADRERWENLQIKFKNQDVFTDDPNVPAQTLIYFSKTNRIVNILFNLFGMALGGGLIYLAYMPNTSKGIGILGAVLILAMLYALFLNLRDIISHKPQIILDSRGIQTISTEFKSWSVISNERVERQYKRRAGIHDFLCYNFSQGRENLDISYYDTNITELEKLLRIYRERSKTQ